MQDEQDTTPALPGRAGTASPMAVKLLTAKQLLLLSLLCRNMLHFHKKNSTQRAGVHRSRSIFLNTVAKKLMYEKAVFIRSF
jgi:hypothetical protein